MNWWLVSAYSLFFGGLGVYAVYLRMKQRELDRRIVSLRDRIEKD